MQEDLQTTYRSEVMKKPKWDISLLSDLPQFYLLLSCRGGKGVYFVFLSVDVLRMELGAMQEKHVQCTHMLPTQFHWSGISGSESTKCTQKLTCIVSTFWEGAECQIHS